MYDEIEIEDMKYDEVNQVYTYPCPCGDRFIISLEELLDGEDIAPCPSCTLRIRVIYDVENLPGLHEEDLENVADIPSGEMEEATVVKASSENKNNSA